MKRRDFIKSSAILAGSFALPYNLAAGEKKIKLAILGTGWWGTDLLLSNALSTGQFEIVGLCDVDTKALTRAADKAVDTGEKKPQLFTSYKEMYKIEGLQAVAIATPTHWHALQFIDACRQGLHVFLEKPISYDIREGQAMLEAQKKAQNIVQVDFPRVMVNTNKKVKEFINSGEAGEIYQVKANINSRDAHLIEKPIPDTIDWETYCGPAPKTKYLCRENNSTSHWRGQHVFNRGIMVDWGIHYLHNIREVLNLDLPDNVSAIGGITRNHTQDNPDHLDVHYQFNGLPVYWSHKSWGYVSPMPENNIGVYYYGEKATIFAGDLGWDVYPSNGGERIKNGESRFMPADENYRQTYTKMMQDLFLEFAEGIKNNSNAGITNNFDRAYKTTSAVIYGDMAYLAKSSLDINIATMDITNNEEAQKMLKREYRKPYKHPYLNA